MENQRRTKSLKAKEKFSKNGHHSTKHIRIQAALVELKKTNQMKNP